MRTRKAFPSVIVIHPLLQGRIGPFVIEGEPCTIDLAVMMPDGRMAGSSGSDRSSILISPLGSSAGFQSCELPEGTWHIIAGAYHIPANGVAVEYEVEVTPKERRLLRVIPMSIPPLPTVF